MQAHPSPENAKAPRWESRGFAETTKKFRSDAFNPARGNFQAYNVWLSQTTYWRDSLRLALQTPDRALLSACTSTNLIQSRTRLRPSRLIAPSAPASEGVRHDLLPPRLG